MACGDFISYYFNNLTRRLVFDKIQCGKAFDIGKIHKYDGYQHGLVLMVYKFFDIKNFW